VSTVGTIRLSDIVLDAQSGFASGESAPDGILQIRMNNVTTDGAWDWSKERRVPASFQQRSKYALAPGDVLVNVTNSPSLVGKTATFSGNTEPVVFSNHFLRLRLDRERAEPEYVRRWLNVQWQRHIFEGLCTQWVNQASVRREDLLALPVPLPPLPEQRRIAAILDKADGVRRKRRETLDLADQFLRSAFLDMFGDPVTNPKGWPVRKLLEAFVTDRSPTKCGPFGSALRKEEYAETGIPVLTMDNIVGNSFALEGCLFVTREKWEVLSQYEVQEGDIIISRAGTVGKMCEVPRLGMPAIISTNLIRLSLNPQVLDPTYFVALMTYCGGRMGILRAGADGSYSFMNTGILRDLRVPFPSQDGQARWRHLVVTMRSGMSRLLLNYATLEALSNSLLRSAFRGRP
jgi:type I restriction enzyme S subunit